MLSRDLPPNLAGVRTRTGTMYTTGVSRCESGVRTPTAAVDITGLHMRYRDVVAVDHVDLTVQPGSITSILGPNGAGKTTTIETCEGFRRPQRGSVRIFGLDPIADAKQLRPRVGVMLQSGGAWSGIRAHEMLHHMASLHADPLPVNELLAELGLTGLTRTPFRRLSGGQQQRLSLAMAVVGRPELVFLDEPTAGLDPQARHATWQLIRELRDSGVTIVLTTHFMDEAETLSDVVYIIDRGRVIASGDPTELMAAGSGNTVRFSAVPGLELAGLRAALPPDTAADELAPGSYRVSGDVSPDLLATLTSWCASMDVLPESILVERQTLEDAFLELTGRSLR